MKMAGAGEVFQSVNTNLRHKNVFSSVSFHLHAKLTASQLETNTELQFFHLFYLHFHSKSTLLAKPTTEIPFKSQCFMVC